MEDRQTLTNTQVKPPLKLRGERPVVSCIFDKSCGAWDKAGPTPHQSHRQSRPIWCLLGRLPAHNVLENSDLVTKRLPNCMDYNSSFSYL